MRHSFKALLMTAVGAMTLQACSAAETETNKPSAQGSATQEGMAEEAVAEEAVAEEVKEQDVAGEESTVERSVGAGADVQSDTAELSETSPDLKGEVKTETKKPTAPKLMADTPSRATTTEEAIIEEPTATEIDRGVTMSETSEANSLTSNEAGNGTSAGIQEEAKEVKSETPDNTSNVNSPNVNTPYNKFLQTYVVPTNGINLVAYDKVTDADKDILEAYIQTLSQTDISNFSVNEKMAYWYNLYNAKTVDLILDNYPLDSIRDIRKPWDQKLLSVRGKDMSLNDIEHKTLRENYDEPRVHFAVNCASIGCPNLRTVAWEAATLDADLDAAARDYVASDRGIKVEGGEITASKIFDWYEKDFGSNEKEVLEYLVQFATGEKKTAMQSAKDIDDFEYDWSLNIVK